MRLRLRSKLLVLPVGGGILVGSPGLAMVGSAQGFGKPELSHCAVPGYVQNHPERTPAGNADLLNSAMPAHFPAIDDVLRVLGVAVTPDQRAAAAALVGMESRA